MPTYNGTAAADSFTAPDSQDWIINGIGGNDTLTGNEGNDTIEGGPGNDILSGAGGNDIFLFGKNTGFDIVDGGAGIDVVKAATDGAVIGLKSFTGVEEFSANGFANVTLMGSSDANVFDFSSVLLTGIITVHGGGGDDIITGNEQANIINGGQGNDTLTGLGGDDVFLFDKNSGFDIISGGSGHDVMKAAADGAVIGLQTFTGIEEITADGHADVRIQADNLNSFLDFSQVLLTGITKISGGGGNDTIVGNDQDNVIEGAGGTDTLIGLAGDDTFLVGGSAGFDKYDGGAGTDTIKATADGATIGLLQLTGIEAITADGHSNVHIVATPLGDTFNFSKVVLTGIASIEGGKGNDVLTGSVGNDVINGGDGDDVISGGLGDDMLSGGAGHDILDGGAGNDALFISAGADVYKGGAGYDVLLATQNGTNLQLDKGLLSGVEEISANGFSAMTISGANAAGSWIDLRPVVVSDGDILAINGTKGDDTIYGAIVSDVINGSFGNDFINGMNGDDFIHGDGGDDTLLGGAGYDELHGDGGNDIIDGGNQDDNIFGEAGNDTIIIGTNPGYDTIDGGTGYDIVKAAAGVSSIQFNSIANVEEIASNGTQPARILGRVSDDHFDFSAVTLTGIKLIDTGDGNDTVVGSNGDDAINGGDGNDTLLGGIGKDLLIGGLGTDTMTGGAGNDVFEGTVAFLQGDTITDFAAGDEIHVLNVKSAAALVLDYTDGVLTISGPKAYGTGIHIAMPGAFTTANFEAVSDGATGALIHLIA